MSNQTTILRLANPSLKIVAEVEKRLDLGGPNYVVWTGPIDEATDELDRSFVLTRAHCYSSLDSAIAYARSFVGPDQIEP